MAKGRHLKHKLKHYNVPPSSSSTAPQQEPVVSVSDRIAQLRIEQRRAEQNRRARAAEQQLHPMAALLPLADLALADTAASSRRLRVAGPPPPPSWRVQRKDRVPCRPPTRFLPRSPTSLESLRTICASKAADALAVRPALATRLSVRTKQCVLPQLGQRLTDRVLRYFINDVYSELCIPHAKVSYAAFLRGFWKTVPLKSEPKLAENWWEEQEQEEEEDESWQDQDEPQTGYVYQNDQRLDSVLAVVGRHQDGGGGSRMLTTPLSAKLISLDISFMPQFPVSFGYLVAFTLPHITQLIMPGSTATADVLLVLSRELKMLQYWDIGFHTWITPLFVCRDIRWDRDLRRLKTLCLANTGPEGNTGQQVVEEMRDLRPHLQVQWSI